MNDILNIGSFLIKNERIILLLLSSIFFFFGMLAFFPLSLKDDEEKTSHWWKMIARRILWGAVIFIIMAYYYLGVVTGNGKYNWAATPNILWYLIFATSFILGVSLRIYKHRVIAPSISKMKHNFRVSQTGDQRSDIRVENGKHNAIDFSPEKHYKNNYIFRGMDETGKPIHEDLEIWRTHNQAAIAPSQFGKGVDIGVQLDQAIRIGECVIFVDPKPDKHARAIMKQACEDTQRKFIEIDLNGETGTHKYAIFKNGSIREIRTRMVTIAGLEDGGTNADYYKKKERRVLDDIIQNNNEDARNIAKLLKILASQDEEQRHGSLESILNEVYAIPSISDNGVDLKKAIMDNSVIYIKGATLDNTVLALTKLIIIDLVQTMFATSKENGGTRSHHIFLVIDEVRFLVTQYLANALATVLATNSHILIAYQGINDIRSVDDSTVDKDALQTSIDINCQSKLIYKAIDSETAEWASELTGTIVKKVTDRADIETNQFGGEIYTGKTMITEVEEAYITANTFLTLPKKVGVRIIPNKLPTIIKTHWVKASLDKFPLIKLQQNKLKPKIEVFKKPKESIEKVLKENEFIDEI